ncbi:MAG: type II secretion system GspH family protein, partial [Desulfobacterales bacterium]|nr:type II secretion system GspH family protein [Desulfobacterales bacterium]
MLKIKRILSKKGFSLIELMVALAILGIAALGIFQAFTVGFQSMADAKYRTVATNIAQEKLEEVKNSVKVAYPYYSIGYQELNGKTFTIIVATKVPPPKPNLEQVYVTVSWHDRQGNEKNVQLETLVYDLQIDYEATPPDVGRIHLSADSTVITCCVEGEVSTITADLFNTADPEDRVPSGTPVSFDVDTGSVNPEFTLTDTNGRATTQLTLNGKNTASVTAISGIVSSSDSEVPLQVTCVPKASKIVLSASSYAITPGSSSIITATVTDTCGDVLSVELNQVEVKFETNFGSFSASESIKVTSKTTNNGIATIVLYSLNLGEVATINGTITVDEVDISNFTKVICTDYSISVTADPPSINPGGDYNTSTITATL